MILDTALLSRIQFAFTISFHILFYLQAAAPDKSLLFMLVGAIIMLSPLLYYTYHSYRIFCGKVTQKISY